MNNLQIFNFEQKKIRTVIDEKGDTWFILRDVLIAMGSKSRPSSAKISIIDGLGDGVVFEYPIIDSLGRSQQVTAISDSAVTFILSRSNTETGKRLNKFIHIELIPQIRKNGFYIDTDKKLTSLTDEQIHDNLHKTLKKMSIELHQKMGCLFNTGNIAKKNLNNMEKSIIRLFNSTGTNVIDQKTIVDAIGRGDDEDGNDVMSSLDNLDMFGILLTNYDGNAGAVYHLIEHPAVNW